MYIVKNLIIDGGLNLTRLAEAVEAKSLRSIRKQLAEIIREIFSSLKGIFQHIKQVFYVLSFLMMIYDGYK